MEVIENQQPLSSWKETVHALWTRGGGGGGGGGERGVATGAAGYGGGTVASKQLIATWSLSLMLTAIIVPLTHGTGGKIVNATKR